MHFNQDKIFIDKEIIFYFTYLEWDSLFFGKQSYSLNISKSYLGVSTLIKKQLKLELNNCFISIKLPTNFDKKILSFLQDCGFYYIDTEVILEHDNSNVPNIQNNSIIEQKKFNKELPYKDFGRSFNLTRFHTDINIDNKLADKLWSEYLKNYSINKNKQMFIAKKDKKIVGVILVNIKDNIATLFYVAILEEYSGQGIGKDLINYALNTFKGYTIQTETQIKNLNALNFYIKSGLKIIKNTYTVLHRW